jgi:divalent metal cation (Fe/Co/Zn/Cd) transporter
MSIALESRRKWLRVALQIQVISVLWTVIEAAVGAVAAQLSGSLAVSAFSVDSAIELVSGIALLLRFVIEMLSSAKSSEARASVPERMATGVVTFCLFGLAAFISWRSGQALATRHPMQVSTIGLILAGLSSVISPWLARMKRRVGMKLDSHALIGDAACTMTCAYMAWVLLLGLGMQWLFGFWWVDPLAALGILYFVLYEAWDSFAALRSGTVHIHDGLHHHSG